MTDMPTPEALAVLFHETYERLAPQFGYETRTETRQFDPTSQNGRLMIAVCGVIHERTLTATQEALKAMTAERNDAVRKMEAGWVLVCQTGIVDAVRRAEKAEAALAEARKEEREPGMVRVPREPTKEMLAAGYRAVGESHYSPTAESLQGWGAIACHVYRAMLSAAQGESRE